MLRRFVMITLVVAVSGLVPLMATGGSCADMPCCHHHGVVVTSTPIDCCSPATCVKEEQAIRAAGSNAQRHHAPVAIVVIPLTATIANHAASAPQQVSWSPPVSTAERLSVLSILLI